MIEKRKLSYQEAFVKMGIAFLDLMKQFMVEPRTIAMLGKGGATGFIEVDPAKLQGSYDVFYDIQGDSLQRQERSAEAQSLYQMALQAAPAPRPVRLAPEPGRLHGEAADLVR